MKHTPTPWGFGDREFDAICAKGGRGFIIHRPRFSETPDQFDHSDLEYIVHCVNNHAGMLETLRQVAELQDHWLFRHLYILHTGWRDCLNQVRETIARTGKRYGLWGQTEGYLEDGG